MVLMISVVLAMVLNSGSLEDAHAQFMKARLEKVDAPSTRSMRDEATKLDARWEEVVRTGPPAGAVTALVRQGELRWHLAAELESAAVPEAITRLGEEAVVTFKDVLAEQATQLP